MKPAVPVLAWAALSTLLILSNDGCFRRESSGDDAAEVAEASPAATQPGGTSGGRSAKEPGTKKSSADARTVGAKAKAETAKSGSASKSGKKTKTTGPVIPPPAVAVVAPAEQLSTEQLRTEVRALRNEHDELVAGVRELTPEEPYILINTTLNRMSMKAGDRVILQDGIVSTGSNTELVETNGERRWFFSTPKGVHVVKRKMVAPVWTKPDWAFIEEGEPVPGAQAEARFEEGTLGKYALYFGNGYMIHGTLFQRFLGQSVTHGCVRVGDADLETVYQNAKVGTKIYIY